MFYASESFCSEKLWHLGENLDPVDLVEFDTFIVDPASGRPGSVLDVQQLPTEHRKTDTVL